MMEKLNYSKINTDFFNRFYVKLLKQIFDEKQFEPFILSILTPVDKEDIQGAVKKNKDEIDQFNSWLSSAIYKEFMKNRTSIVKGKSIGGTHGYFCNGNLKNVGHLNNDETLRTGQWYSYYSNGCMEYEGAYTNEGKLDGKWINYYAKWLAAGLIVL